jgi:ribonuclease HI/probable phosphoglycerate mutase
MRMAPELPGRETAIRTLVAALDDAVLARSFPGQAPATMRQLLVGEPAEGGAVETPAPSGPARATATIGRCRLFTDGASRGNPGEAGAGAVVCDPAGGELAARSAYLGQCTNNVAEYRALLLGLEEARRLGCRELDISLDSELIVRQLQGRYKVKNETLQTLFREVQGRLAGFTRWTVGHVPRAKNARADELANRGIDEKKTQ